MPMQPRVYNAGTRYLLNFDVFFWSVIRLHVVETAASLEIQIGTNELATHAKIEGYLGIIGMKTQRSIVLITVGHRESMMMIDPFISHFWK